MINISYIIGGLMGVGLIGGLLITSATAPEMPDRKFDYAAASPQAKVDWLTAYGHFAHYQMDQHYSSDKLAVKFVSVDPSIRAASINMDYVSAKPVDPTVLETEEFQAAIAGKSYRFQKKTCKKGGIRKLFVDGSKLMFNFSWANAKANNVEVSAKVCAKIAKRNKAKSLFKKLKN